MVGPAFTSMISPYPILFNVKSFNKNYEYENILVLTRLTAGVIDVWLI